MSADEKYLPLWDSRKGAITSYLYCPEKLLDNGNLLAAFNLFSQDLAAQDVFSEDLKSIRAVKKELHAMATSGRRLFVLCPVHYRTLKVEHYFLGYIGECRKIPEQQRQYLILVLLDLPGDIAQMEIERCVSELRKCARRVYAQTEISFDVDFQMLGKAGLDVVGICLDKSIEEKRVMEMMEFYSRKAEQSGVREIFAFNLSSLSLTTSAVCSGYTYLGGKAIHGLVKSPDHIYKFENEHLFKGLLKKGESTTTD